MCLTRVDPKPKRKFGVGYKSVKKQENGTYTCYDHVPHAGTVDYPLNQWVTDPNDGKADTAGKPSYRTGFHILLDKGVAVRLNGGAIVAIKVRYRKVVATDCSGYDTMYGKQVVAREIMNLGEVQESK